jgi:GAF domain-containing protein
MVQSKEPNAAYDKQLVALGRVLQTLREGDNADALVEALVAYLTSEFEYALIWVGLYDRVEHRLHGRGGMAPGNDTAILRQRFSLNPGDVLEQVVIQQRAVSVPDLREEQRAGTWRKTAQKFNIQATVIFPIRYRDICYGVVLLGSAVWGVAPRADEKARISMVLGEYAAALYKIEADWQRQQVKHPDQPLLALLAKMRSLEGLGNRLEAVVEEAHQFIQPTRTSIYWYERERRYFWRRLGNRQKGMSTLAETNQSSSGITVQEVSSFYQALAAAQVVSVGEAQSSLKADTTARLMQQIKARSLLAAPILCEDELLGFLAVEGNEPRIWSEGEKNFMQGAAQLISLTIPLDEMETTIEQIRLDGEITTEVARSIYDEEDWKTTLRQAADHLCKRLKADRFMVLLYDDQQDLFEISFQSQPSNRRPLSASLNGLSDADFKMLQQSSETVTVENLDSDLKLLAWRDRLLELGVRSLILCNTSIGHGLEGLVVLCYESPRSWSRIERELLRLVSQQLGFILHQWQLQRQTDQLQAISQSVKTGLLAIQQQRQLEVLERIALQHIAQVMQAPLAVMVSWMPGRAGGRIVSSPSPSDRFIVKTDLNISINTDLLVRWTVETPNELIQIAATEIPANTRQWLYGTGIGQVLAIPLMTDETYEVTGVVIVVDEAHRRWSDRQITALKVLASQVAWARRHVTLIDVLAAQRSELERVNWYKNRRLEEVYRAVLAGLKRLEDLGTPKEKIFATRQEQIKRQLNEAIALLPQVLQEETWKMRLYPMSISLITLLKRSLERVEFLIKQRQLWSQVHNETNLIISGDILKIELVLYELLLTACQRCNPGGRIDLWCRQIDNRWLELSITDNGHVEPRLLTELESERTDWLSPSILDHPPGLHLIICQALMKQIGGSFTFYKLEDGRVVSCLVLPLEGNPAIARSKKSPDQP